MTPEFVSHYDKIHIVIRFWILLISLNYLFSLFASGIYRNVIHAQGGRGVPVSLKSEGPNPRSWNRPFDLLSHLPQRSGGDRCHARIPHTPRQLSSSVAEPASRPGTPGLWLARTTGAREIRGHESYVFGRAGVGLQAARGASGTWSLPSSPSTIGVRRGQPRRSTYSSHAPASCEVKTAARTSVV